MSGTDHLTPGQLYCAGHSLSRIAKAKGLKLSTTRLLVLREGVALRSPADGVRLAAKEGRLRREGSPGKRSAASRERMSAAQRRRHEATAKGVSLKPNGYLEFTRGPNKGRLVHRVVMEEHIGRRLKRFEHVHHKDGNRQNNALENLEVLFGDQHARHHRLAEGPRKRRANGQFSGKGG